MNTRMIIHILSHMLRVEAVLMLLPTLVAFLYRETGSAFAFLIVIALLLVLSCISFLKKPLSKDIYEREGFIVVALSWILLSFFGALPFVISGEIPHLIDAFFETASGFSTTGASILTNVEALSYSMLFWRSFTHWIGGMGVLVFALMIVPLAGNRSMHIMRAEVPGPTVGKLVPKIKNTATILYGIYVALSLIQLVLLLAGGMPLFDSFIHVFGTAGTGGFSIKNASIGFYDSAYFDVVITVFMLLFGVNFNLFYLIIIGKARQVLKSEELKTYLGIVFVSILAITLNILPRYNNFFEALRYSSFQVSSIITTTGYATADFNLWPELSRCILLLLMLIGACAGSTGGGIKVARVVLMWKSAINTVKRLIKPKSVHVIKLEGVDMSEYTIASTNVYLVVYLFITLVSILVVSFDNFDFETTVSSVIACFNNIGPGIGLCGATGNYSMFSDVSKFMLSFDMLFGRLEIFPLIMLFTPSIWKRDF